jgi:hypothetical protein
MRDAGAWIFSATRHDMEKSPRDCAILGVFIVSIDDACAKQV